jgi:hypothetical protein
MVVSDWKLAPISKMKVSGLYFCAFCNRSYKNNFSQTRSSRE